MRRSSRGGRARTGAVLLALAAVAFGPGRAAAQQIDLSHGGPIDITAKGGIEWLQQQQEVVASGDAKAIRANVTVTADRLTAWYRKKADATSGGAATANSPGATARESTNRATTNPGTTAQRTSAEGASAPGTGAQGPTAQGPAAQGPAAQGPTAPGATAQGPEARQGPPAQQAQPGLEGDTDTGGNEVYRVQAEGHVHIYTQTDQVWGDVATYDLDQAVLVVTGHNLRLTTPNDVITARDDLEYWSQRHMAVARGNAVVVTNDGRRLQGDILVAYTTDAPTAPDRGAAQATPVADRPGAAPNPQNDPLLSSGKLQKVEVFGHVLVRTVTDTVTGDRAVYVPDSGIARVAGHVHITRGQNQLDGSEAIVNMKTGISHLLASNDGRVQGLIVPNDQTSQSLVSPAAGPRQPETPRPATATGKQP